MPQPRTVDDLAAAFCSPDPDFGPVPIWWWSGARLERSRLRWQMSQLLAAGVRQAVVMCLAPRGPLYGSLADDPPFLSEPWWEVFLGACEDAHELGFRFWLYDQYGFSGANFQGQLVVEHPTWAGQELKRASRDLTGDTPVRLTLPAASVALSAYVAVPGRPPVPVPLDDDGSVQWSGRTGRLTLCYAQERGFDYYDENACAALIDTVLGEFRRRADKWFGPVITGLFQDELPHMPSWGKRFAQTFEQSYGYDLRARLALLWEGDDQVAAACRRDYHEHRGALARSSFFEPYGAWATEAGLICGFDQQSPAREGDPAGATALYGDYLSTHAVFSAPGSDHWGDPKLHSSLAHASGQPRTWLEAFHSSGWGGTLEETYDWLGPFLRRGANLYDPHAVYYSTAGGWWEWAPPSTCWRQPYWPDYHVFSDAVSRLCSLTASGSLVADTVLLFPTSSVQTGLGMAGEDAAARRTSDVYHQLNGSTSWFDERPGVLDRAGRDYEILDESTLSDGEVADGTWRVAAGTFHNIVLPAVAALDGRFAEQLARFVLGGGTVVSVGPLPELYVGPHAASGWRLQEVLDRLHVVDDPEDVVEKLTRGSVWAEADAPHQLRRCGDALVLLLVAHDEQSGTRMPVFPGNGVADRISGEFSWSNYWTSFVDEGYEFRPVADRRARVRVVGSSATHAQRWDPRTGERVQLDVQVDDDGTVLLDVPFADGPLAVVVLGELLPAATRADPAGEPRVQELGEEWEVEACSSLDNQWGDLGDPARREVLPVQVWRFEHTVGEPSSDAAPTHGWASAFATFGPYLRVSAPYVGTTGPTAWQPYVMSLSRGIRKDPLHYANLGPKGTVPEEFIRWESVRDGESVAMATTLDLAGGRGCHLVVGADADRQVILDGAAVTVDGDGYWTTSPLPDGRARVHVEIRLQRPQDGGIETATPRELRATFAVVTDVEGFRRPEWLVPADGSSPGTTVTFTAELHVDEVPDDASIQVGSEGPCSVLVNGHEVGRQGAFEPYPTQRRPHVMPYDVSRWLHREGNTIQLRIDDLGGQVAAWVDSRPREDGGPGLVSGPGWSCARDDDEVGCRLRKEQWSDPRWACLWARPHPLPAAAWLDGRPNGDVVRDVVPDAGEDEPRREWLRFVAPVGATELRVPTDVPFVGVVDDVEIAPDPAGTLVMAAPLRAGTTVQLRFDARGGHRAGGLLSGPVEVEVAPTVARLADWEDLGLRNLAGSVRYRISVEVPPPGEGGAVVLDLGRVRGSAEVVVNGTEAATLLWTPYRVDLTPWLQPGQNQLEVVVRGTLAGYLDDASPTPGVYRGQTRHGLLGPVRLLHFAPERRMGGER